MLVLQSLRAENAMENKRPQIKFYKDAVPDIISGHKTLEPRPRSPRWIRQIQSAELVDFTYGPRIGPPHIFAAARIARVEIRNFETATKQDLKQIALGWQGKKPEEFIKEYNRWFSKELEKGYPVAWIYFKVEREYNFNAMMERAKNS